MLKGYRSRLYTIGLAVAALIAVGVGTWLWQGALGLEAANQQQAEAHADYYAHRADIAAERRCSELPAPSKTDCIAQERESAREAQRQEYDLQAQRNMAVWTRTMGMAALIGMAVGIVGVGLIFVTFRETRVAAQATERMAFDTPLAIQAAVEANNEMREANELTRRMIQIENRPVVILESVGFRKDTPSTYTMFRAMWKNVGKTPAIVLKTTFSRAFGDMAHLQHYADALRNEVPWRVTEKSVVLLPDSPFLSEELVVRGNEFSAGFKIQPPIRDLDLIGEQGNWDAVLFVARIEYQAALLKDAPTYCTDTIHVAFPIWEDGRHSGEYRVHIPAGMTEMT